MGVNKGSGKRQGEEHARLCNDYGDITPDVELPIGVGSRYLNASVFEALLEGFPENDTLASGY